MKHKVFLSLLALVLLITCSVALGEGTGEWTCPNCNTTATGNFCNNCGEKRPANENWICPDCGSEATGKFCSNCGAKRADKSETNLEAREIGEQVRLDLDIAFEKNAYFSTYDVQLFIDDELITTIPHGTDYTGTTTVAPGKHVIKFQEARSSYPSKGSTLINVNDPTLFKCEIHAKMDAIQITGERTEDATDEQPIANKENIIKVDGDLELQVNIEFRKNGIFSQYDVDLYLDKTYIATLPHGKDYQGKLLVSKGQHMIYFYKSHDKSVRGNCSFKVEKDSDFSCKIEAERNRVYVTNDKLIYK